MQELIDKKNKNHSIAVEPNERRQLSKADSVIMSP